MLNERQLAAVETTSKHVRIIAGAGSGKTRVLTYRIAYLIDRLNTDPARILAITFTNKVAREMQERAMKLVGEIDGGGPLKIMTFHSFAARFLRREAEAIDYPPGFVIYDDDDQSRLVKGIAETMGYRKSDPVVKEALRYIRSKKNRGLYPSDIDQKRMFNRDKTLLDFYAAYEKRKCEMYALDFDDLLLQCHAILKNNPAIAEKWRNYFDHILVDEFQDTNDVQFDLIKLLCKPSTSVYVVGDPDQTIYTWRGAKQEIILNFEKTFPDAETVVLDRNYRSTKKILKAANALISHNRKRVPKDLYTEGEDGEDIATFDAPTSDREAEWVCRKVRELADKNKNEDGEPDFSNTAILYRSSYLTRPFEQVMARMRIPYRIFGGLRFYERMEVKDLLAYFSILVNPKNDVAFERIINVPRRNIGDTSVARLRQEAADSGVSEYAYLLGYDGFAEISQIPARAANSMVKLVGILEETRKKLEKADEAYPSILKDFVKQIGYMEYLKDDQEGDEDRVGNVNALFDDIVDFLKKNPDSTLDEYLQNVTLLTSQDDMNAGNYVSLMTVHVAKGLEFDNVFVIGLNADTFPSQRALEEDDRDAAEEERRLAYVAFTRAKKRLFLSCNRSYSYATDGHAVPSPYFKEAGLKIKAEGNLYGGGFNRTYGGTSFSGDRFYDGNHISPFSAPAPAAKAHDDLPDLDWKVGDIAEHDLFGRGTVVEKISDDVIVIDFGNLGKKTLLAKHPKLHKAVSKGGEA